MIRAEWAPDSLASEDGMVHEGRSFVWRINALADDCLFQAGRRSRLHYPQDGIFVKECVAIREHNLLGKLAFKK